MSRRVISRPEASGAVVDLLDLGERAPGKQEGPEPRGIQLLHQRPVAQLDDGAARARGLDLHGNGSSQERIEITLGSGAVACPQRADVSGHELVFGR